MVSKYFPKKKTIPITITFFGSLLIMGLLYILSGMGTRPPNGFYRRILSAALEPTYRRTIPDNSYYIAGITGTHIYLGDLKTPGHLYISDLAFKDTQTTTLTFTSKLQTRSTTLVVDSPNVNLSDYNSGILLSGRLQDKAIIMDKADSFFFIDQVPVSANSIVRRTLNNQQTVYLLSKIRKHPFQNGVNFPLSKQTEGLFSTDGMLALDKTEQTIVYTYFYRNQFICLDTNLNLRFIGNTIDTNHYAKIKVGKIESEKSLTLSAPPLIVNNKSCVSQGILYIQSVLKADNEDETTFTQSAVIDLYALRDGKYRGSLYLRNERETRLFDFKISGNKLIALFDGYAALFEIDPGLISQLRVDRSKQFGGSEREGL